MRKYAAHTGTRIFLTPAYFESGDCGRFVDGASEHPIYFDYPWSESDSVEIQLPDGYQLDHPDAPAPLQFAPAGNYSANMFITKTNELIYQRQLVFAADSHILFDVKAYPTLKAIFDRIHTGDSHIVTLKAEPQASPQIH